MTDQLFHAFATFAGRVAKTSDPRVHQNAASQLQRDLKAVKMEFDKSNRPTDAATAQAQTLPVER